MYYYKIGNKTYKKEEPITKNIEKFTEITESEYNELVSKRQTTHIKTHRIAELKRNLANTDYQAIKYAEGQLTEQEYAPMKTQRQAWRDEINQLEQSLT